MKHFFAALFFLSVFLPYSFGQLAHIGGVINSYAGITNIDYCTNKLTATSVSGFFSNQKVLLIQMKGAQIVTDNNAQFGTVTDYGNCGNYEINTIEWISGNDIKLKYAIQRDYTAGDAVQLVSIPEYTKATTDSALRAKPWDGTSGGVFIIKADTLLLTDSITVAGMGFRGAATDNEITCWNNGVNGAGDYICPTNVCGARKGEGIGNSPSPYGRGCNANGGGGGDDHNTGGGGGSNYGAGGTGGKRSNVSNFSCPGPSPGEGGKALPYSNSLNKIFMGGGGGAGDENNNEGTAGGNGGGICIIQAKLLVGNDVKINANGNHVSDLAQSDGAGAGGAGGTVLLDVADYISNLAVDANGGNGGVLDNGGSMSFCFGPGAGGGGGVLWVSDNTVPNAVQLTDTGGINGMNIFGSAPPACPYGTTNGAQPGSAGGTVTGLVIPEAHTPFVALSASACCDTVVCPGTPIRMSATGTATFPPTFLWSNGVNDSTLTETVNSSTTYTVTVSDQRGCHIVLTQHAFVPDLPISISAEPDSFIQLGQSVQLIAHSDSAVSYQWNPTAGLNFSDHYNPVATPDATTTYCVTVTNESGCTNSACHKIELLLPDVKIPDAFSPNNDGVNDVLTLFPSNYATIESIEIYNRWGEVVFRANTNTAWDGAYRGKPQETGVYVCKVIYGSPLNKEKTNTIVHSVILIR